jgi:hypothetical protein
VVTLIRRFVHDRDSAIIGERATPSEGAAAPLHVPITITQRGFEHGRASNAKRHA